MPQRCERLVIAGILLGFIAFRLPFLLYQSAGEDEPLLSVAGLTMAREGVPRIPYMRMNSADSIYRGTERALMFYPAGGFLTQAAFFLCLPPGHPTARLASFAAALTSIWLVWLIGRKVYGAAAGLWAAGLFALSRPLFFAAVSARMDAQCAMFGLAAFAVLWDFSAGSSLWRIVLAGIWLGLGLFTHPFAVVYSLVCGVWVLATPQPLRRRFTSAALLTATALVGLALWLPFVLKYPDEFRQQFFHNVVHRIPGSLVVRLLWPWPYVTTQLGTCVDNAGRWQSAAMGVGALAAVVCAWRARDRRFGRFLLLAIGCVYVQIAWLGSMQRPPYWCFSTALTMVPIGGLLLQVASFGTIGRAFSAVLGLLVTASFLPQSGLTRWSTLVASPADARTRGTVFVQNLVDGLPREGRFVVEGPFILETWLSGRDAVLHEFTNSPPGPDHPYDWLLLGREGVRKQFAAPFRGELVDTDGWRDDPEAPYAELYRITSHVVPASGASTSRAPERLPELEQQPP